jgi:hypothetical protein
MFDYRLRLQSCDTRRWIASSRSQSRHCERLVRRSASREDGSEAIQGPQPRLWIASSPSAPRDDETHSSSAGRPCGEIAILSAPAGSAIRSVPPNEIAPIGTARRAADSTTREIDKANPLSFNGLIEFREVTSHGAGAFARPVPAS